MQVETVVGVHNGASSTINITALAGSLNNVKAFAQHFQNFTAQVHHPWGSVSPAKQLYAKAYSTEESFSCARDDAD